jgi:phage terminase large subunit-like protein
MSGRVLEEETAPIWTPSSTRYRRDPWDKEGKLKDVGGQLTTPDLPIDFTGRDYAAQAMTMTSESSFHTKRDSLIESIMDLDESRKELIRRLILEEDRLDVLMRLLGYRAPPHQMMLNQFLTGKQFGLVLAPRGSGKSTSCDFCYAIMRVLQNRNLRVLIASRTMEQAKDFLFEVKSNLEKEVLVEIFGNLKGDKWDETRADIAGRTQHTKEHTFTIAGADGAVVSKHFDLIIGDDIVEDKNSRTEAQRKQLLKFFYRSMLPCLRPDGELRMLGTRYHPEDLYGYLIEHDPQFKNNWFVLPAVFDRDTGEAVDLEQDKNGNFFAPSNATCYDPVGYPMKKLLQRRGSTPLADWECQYQNRIDFMDGDYFMSDWFQYYDKDPFKLMEELDLAVWMGVDLAISLKDDADEFAMVVIGIVPGTFDIYILDFYSGKFTFNRQKEEMLRFYDKWKPVRTFVESNAYQAALTSTTIQEFPDVRAVQIYTTKDKITRARALQLYYERRQMFHRKGRSAKLETELVGFPNIKLKDLFDALFFAVNGALQGAARKRRKKEDEPELF